MHTSSPLGSMPDFGRAFSFKVLLVDDQLMIGEAVRRSLIDEKDIEFHFCRDSHQALERAREIHPTVILQDLIMPDADGLKLVADYRADPVIGDVPIIVLSSKEDPVVKSAAFASGANDYLVKLPDAIELIARIRYHSRSYLASQQRDEAYEALRESQQQLLETNMKLQQLMHSDSLTGLSNRRHFDEYLDMEWRRAQRRQSQLSLLMIDVDHFKHYNDAFGHVAGDDALYKVAQTLRVCCHRSVDRVARYGGEEFAVILPETQMEGALLIAEKMRDAVESLRILHPFPNSIGLLTISVGVATVVPGQNTRPDLLIDLADQGLYRAKNSGRNRVALPDIQPVLKSHA